MTWTFDNSKGGHEGGRAPLRNNVPQPVTPPQRERDLYWEDTRAVLLLHGELNREPTPEIAGPETETSSGNGLLLRVRSSRVV